MSFEEHMHIISIGYCYGLFASLLNSFVESLIPNVIVFGVRIPEEMIKVK